MGVISWGKSINFLPERKLRKGPFSHAFIFLEMLNCIYFFLNCRINEEKGRVVWWKKSPRTSFSGTESAAIKYRNLHSSLTKLSHVAWASFPSGHIVLIRVTAKWIKYRLWSQAPGLKFQLDHFFFCDAQRIPALNFTKPHFSQLYNENDNKSTYLIGLL